MQNPSFRNNPKCSFNDTGFCKYGDQCRKMHYKTICSIDNCDKRCHSRHPKPCKHGGKCKFFAKKICASKHDTIANDDEKAYQTLKKSHEILRFENLKNLSKIKELQDAMESLKAKTNVEITSLKITVKTLEKKLDSVIKCNSCDKIFNSQVELSSHRQLYHQKIIIFVKSLPKLQEESIISEEETDLGNDVTEQNEDKEDSELFKYESCDKTLESKVSLTNHKQENHKSVIIQVESNPIKSCEKEIKLDANIPRKESSEKKQQPLIVNNYQCDVCAKILSSKTSLFEHQYRHCQFCGNLSTNLVQLKTHTKSCYRLHKKAQE